MNTLCVIYYMCFKKMIDNERMYRNQIIKQNKPKSDNSKKQTKHEVTGKLRPFTG